MKLSALAFLVCPTCQAELQPEVTERSGAEVLQGNLRCRDCKRAYPIHRGVPRFVTTGAYASSFGFQWNRFRTVQLDSCTGRSDSAALLARASGWTDEQYRGRLVLDAGVGAGRYAEVVADRGGEVVGVDLTTAIDAAFANIGRRPGVHLIQTDIFSMPFREETFDLAYSIGVLHHTPDPAAAFARVARVVRKGGGLAVYLYAQYGLHHFSDLIRRVTTRLPLRLMFAASAAAIPLYYLYRVPGAGRVARVVAPISMHEDWRIRWLDTFDWYTPTYQWKLTYPEVARWFRASGFHDIELFDEPIRMRGVKTAAAVPP